jgi:hypothetical protein
MLAASPFCSRWFPLVSRDILISGSAFAVVAIIGKLASGLGCPSAMNRCAVGIGKGIGVIDDGLFSAIVILVTITTFLAPVLLRLSLGPGSFSSPHSVRRA